MQKEIQILWKHGCVGYIKLNVRTYHLCYLKRLWQKLIKIKNTVFVAIPSSWVNTISDIHSTHMGRKEKLIMKSSMKDET